MSNWTKAELEEELETLRSTLEEAHQILTDALGYEEEEDEDGADDDH